MSIRTMVESIMGGDESSEPETPESADAEGGEFGGLEDGEDDLGGLEGDGDGFGGMDDGDEFGAMDDGGGQVDELEHRIDEVETEIDDLSSTVETVRTENEQISASVADVEENVRKLLDIYEMVTNGVNPFADDVDAGAGGGSMGGDFGLFDDEGADGGSDDAVDEDVAEADPEGFFDEDLDEDELGVDDEPAVDDVFGDEPPDDPTGTTDADPPESAPEPADGGTSFEDLKAEYDSDDEGGHSGPNRQQNADPPADESTETSTDTAQSADGQPGDAGPASSSAPDSEFDERPTEHSTPATESDRDPDSGAEGATATAESGPTPTSGVEGDTPREPTRDNPRANGGSAGVDSRSSEGDRERGNRHASPRSAKPYLSSIPGGYASDLVVTEWLEPMVAKAGVRETANALEYYESIGWLAPGARERLEDRLGGFEGGGDGTLDTEDHERSLQYVSQLAGGSGAAVGRATLSIGGGSDGVQR